MDDQSFDTGILAFDLTEELTRTELLKFIKDLDDTCEDMDFTIRLTKQMLDVCIEMGEPLDFISEHIAKRMKEKSTKEAKAARKERKPTRFTEIEMV